jgi:hypothetical protein
MLRQLLAELLPSVELVPEGHCWQVDTSLAPTLSEYLPAVHNTQSDSASFPVVAKYFPAPQLAQPELPTVAEYFPASHTEHVPPLLPEYPALHEQELTEVLPCGEPALLVHNTHVSDHLAPKAGE